PGPARAAGVGRPAPRRSRRGTGAAAPRGVRGAGTGGGALRGRARDRPAYPPVAATRSRLPPVRDRQDAVTVPVSCPYAFTCGAIVCSAWPGSSPSVTPLGPSSAYTVN